ncbi:SLC13 family permease [Corynebacterium qintianiae]|uniref:SLC13 family permease n=1 Tax=Corynebacterium qintianiae TaxID=2709392 RepID=UPI0013EBC933|nr:SLC13 family permease [Corynebacterium qintianiae]
MTRTRFLLPFFAAASVAALAAVDTTEAVTLLRRLLPVLGFAGGMSVVVNLASEVGVFEWAAARVRRFGFLALCVVATVFLSLDTTAIMLTPLAVHLARRRGSRVTSLALPVVWIANLASLPLAVSNLTNLLALGTIGPQYVRIAAAPSLVAIAVAVIAALLIDTHPTRSPTNHGDTPAPPVAALAVVGAAMCALLTPIPYWVTSSAAALAMVLLVGSKTRGALRLSLIPWSALALALALSSAATAAITLWGTVSVSGVWAMAGAGAVAANLINNIPAYFLLEPAASGPTELVALLIGVNAGAIVTPWASLATLLWADQLRRAGEPVPWRQFVCYGALLAPLAVAGATGALVIAQR